MLFPFVVVFTMGFAFINFCLNNNAKISLAYNNTHLILIPRPVDQLQNSAPGYRFGSGLFIYPHLSTQAEETAASWSVLVFLQVRGAKSLAILSKSPH